MDKAVILARRVRIQAEMICRFMRNKQRSFETNIAKQFQHDRSSSDMNCGIEYDRNSGTNSDIH